MDPLLRHACVLCAARTRERGPRSRYVCTTAAQTAPLCLHNGCTWRMGQAQQQHWLPAARRCRALASKIHVEASLPAASRRGHLRAVAAAAMRLRCHAALLSSAVPCRPSARKHDVAHPGARETRFHARLTSPTLPKRLVGEGGQPPCVMREFARPARQVARCMPVDRTSFYTYTS